MPVTARLSSKFYERFGDDIATELVDWFNAVDSTYQTQLREINDLNWERFKVTLLAESASIRGDMTSSVADLRSEFRTGVADLRTEFRTELANLRTEFRTELAELRTEFRTELDTVRRDLLKWMFIYWSGLFIGLAGMITGLAVFLK